MSPALAVVADRQAKPPQTVAQHIRALQAEARTLAVSHAEALHAALADLHAMAAEIAAGGEAYAPGVRAVARDIALSSESQGLTLQAITGRSAT